MDEFPDPEDEYEMMHQEELEAMRDVDQDFDIEEAMLQASAIPQSSKRSLDFTSPKPAQPAITKPPQQDGLQPSSTTLPTASGTSGSNTHKRPAQDAFTEDLSPYLSNNFLETRKKRHKPLLPEVGLVEARQLAKRRRHEADLALIQRITHVRNTLQAAESLEAAAVAAAAAPLLQPRESSASSKIHHSLPDTAFQALTTEAGQRFYLTKLEEEQWEARVAGVAASHHTTCLLTTPYSVLKAEAEREQVRQDARKAAQLQDEESGREEREDPSDCLWVENFKPHHYLDLLSDESTNRLVLHWMKLWDKIVFGIDRKIYNKEKKKQAFQKGNPFIKGKFNPRPGQEVIDELDEQNRPKQKVILLCGPPGLGKTTLAHIIAQHAGYNVVEMNASDDRSLQAFRTRLENATSMKAVLGPNPRPNCLIIDEIDGAPAPSINLLVNVLTGKDKGAGKGKKARKDGLDVLQRPVICICNELYTPALRPLRVMALVIKFPPIHSTRLAQRLMEISSKKKLRADMSVLISLCDKTENDIRACLSFLQFVRSNKSVLGVGDLEGAAVGQKDYQRSLFTVWHQIFTIPRPKKLRRANPHDLQQEDGALVPMPDLAGELDSLEQSSPASRYHLILRTTQSCGEYERLTQGWFENYLTVKMKNTLLEPLVLGLEWATFTDVVNSEMMHSQSWSLMAFLPYACVAFHFLFATNQRPKINFPSQMFENNQKLGKSQSLVGTMLTEMPPLTRAFVSPMPLVQDVLPFLLHIIQPSLRPVNTQLYSKKEKKELAEVINIMISYNLTYTQERDTSGVYSFLLDPNMEAVVHYPNQKPAKQLSYTMRQLISREVELEKVRRAEAYFQSHQTQPQADGNNTETSKKAGKSSTKASSHSSSNTRAQLPNHLQKLQAKPIEAAPTVQVQPRDFFGRVIDRPAEDKTKCMTNEIVKSDIWFRFKEGYSNAVRRTMKMKDLV